MLVLAQRVAEKPSLELWLVRPQEKTQSLHMMCAEGLLALSVPPAKAHSGTLCLLQDHRTESPKLHVP